MSPWETRSALPTYEAACLQVLGKVNVTPYHLAAVPRQLEASPTPLSLAHRESLLDRPRTKPLLAPSLAVPRECPLPADSRAFAPINSESELPSTGSAPVFHGQSSWPAQRLPFKWDGQRSSSSLLCPLKCRRYILSLKRSYSYFEMKGPRYSFLRGGRFTAHQPLSSKIAPLTSTTLSPLNPPTVRVRD